ncbi:hypothetical protein BBP40_004504 [Aspergillus hancockii]|nr:hypothetical protein BBP40_004504 [Aspergillus hancockii]
MDSLSAWVAPLVERYLSLYVRGQVDSSELEDDGSNLRFASRSIQYAIVLDWTEGEEKNMSTLTDFSTQIEAVLAKESLEELKRESPGHSFNREAFINDYVQLLDYEVVLEYAVSPPKVHLYVKHFRLVLDRGKYKGAPQGKGIKKNGTIRRLMARISDIVKSRESRHTTSQSDAYCFDDSLNTQAHEISREHASQHFLQSQAQASFVDSTGVPPMIAPYPSKRSSASSSALLGYLGPHTKAANSGVPVNDEYKTVARSLDDEALVRAEARESSLRAAKSFHEAPHNEAAQEKALGPNLKSTLAARHNSPIILEQRQDVDRELPVNEVDERSFNDSDGRQGHDAQSTETLYHEHADEGQSTLLHQPSPKRTALGTRRGLSPSHVDPWHGMAGIRTRDIRIPKNQAALFEQHTRQFVPPISGTLIQGYVPPELLAQWNEIVLQRSRLAQQKELESLEPGKVESPQPSPVTNSPTPQTDAESDDELGSSQWSESSPERVSRPLRALPADSSPVTRVPVNKRNDLRGANSDNALEKQQPKEVSLTPTCENLQDLRAISEARQDHDGSMETSQSGNNRPANEGQSSGLDYDDIRASGHDLQGESDAESEDSIMDTSVPCPLEGSQRSVFTNQSEQVIVSPESSLPALPTTRGHVQVMETPVANLSRLRPTRLRMGNATLESHHPDQLSSQAAKLSSQSRIVNTYASNDGDAEGTQESNIHTTNEEPNDVDVLGTQLSDGKWSMRNPTPNSQTPFVLDSSAPRDHESNAPIPTSTLESQDSSKPFSSHDEMISSMESEVKNEDAATGKGSSCMEHSQTSPLKRPASSFEVEEPPSSKRLRAREDEGANASIVELNKPASGVFSRRQVYIHRSTEHLEAQRVYEKFRNDYPSYAGDFLHFTKLCFMLRRLRAKGSLQRSFLWDDFVINHLEEYPRYLEKCLFMETKSLVYEEYFTLNFSKPSHKKRSLTAEGIKVVAAQNVPASDAAMSPPRSRNGAETSFTASLVDKFSNFHAHSFGPATQGTQSDTDDDRMSFTMSSPTPITKTSLRTPADEQLSKTKEQLPAIEEHHSDADEQHPESHMQLPGMDGTHSGPEKQRPAIEETYSEAEELQPEIEVHNYVAKEQHSEMNEYHSESEEQLHMEMGCQIYNTPRDVPEPAESIIAESEINSDEDDLMDETHEIASIELGDEEPSPGPLSDSDNDNASEASEAESINENWFLSLRHIVPTGPSWCDDSNTPFKKWARADQNVFAERKFRRDWAPIPADNKGVPQRPCYSNPPPK